MSICWIGDNSVKIDSELLTGEMFEGRYFLPGIVHGDENYLICIYLNDAHYDDEEAGEYDQFEIEYIWRDLILDADVKDPSHGEVFNEIIAAGLESFGCPNDGEGDFADWFEAWPDAIKMSNDDIVKWAKDEWKV